MLSASPTRRASQQAQRAEAALLGLWMPAFTSLRIPTNHTFPQNMLTPSPSRSQTWNS